MTIEIWLMVAILGATFGLLIFTRCSPGCDIPWSADTDHYIWPGATRGQPERFFEFGRIDDWCVVHGGGRHV